MRIGYTATATAQLDALDVKVRSRIIEKMRFFRTQPEPLAFAKHLVGYNAHRFRIGNYRVLCEVRDEILIVILVVKREGAYKNL
jgi:mRNA-degrading endonuclease RelE of RelBE toxin-antitoxin system